MLPEPMKPGEVKVIPFTEDAPPCPNHPDNLLLVLDERGELTEPEDVDPQRFQLECAYGCRFYASLIA